MNCVFIAVCEIWLFLNCPKYLPNVSIKSYLWNMEEHLKLEVFPWGLCSIHRFKVNGNAPTYTHQVKVKLCLHMPACMCPFFLLHSVWVGSHKVLRALSSPAKHACCLCTRLWQQTGGLEKKKNLVQTHAHKQYSLLGKFNLGEYLISSNLGLVFQERPYVSNCCLPPTPFFSNLSSKAYKVLVSLLELSL